MEAEFCRAGERASERAQKTKQDRQRGLKSVSRIWQVVKRYSDVHARARACVCARPTMRTAAAARGSRSFRNNLGDGIPMRTRVHASARSYL